MNTARSRLPRENFRVWAMHNTHPAYKLIELVAVLGPNGAGKSTLLRTINLLQPYRGEMQLFGQDIRNANETLLRRRSALVFQETLMLN